MLKSPVQYLGCVFSSLDIVLAPMFDVVYVLQSSHKMWQTHRWCM